MNQSKYLRYSRTVSRELSELIEEQNKSGEQIVNDAELIRIEDYQVY